jgi:signal transduction histidine kinase
MEPLDLISVISEIRSSWSYYLHKEQIRFFIQADPGTAFYVYGARSKLFQLFHNLISNAVKAIQQKKETCRSPHITHITVHLSKEQGHIVLNLSDTGIGMTTEQQSRAFYRGVSFHPGGNGIGLSVVQNIARDLHIKIHIDSAPNQGTTFTLIFPAYEQQLSCPTRTEALTK